MTIYDDEIDLRPYINAVVKNWWKIGLLAVVLAVFVFIFTRLQAPSYQATATILIPRSQLQLSIADQFPTIVDSGDSKSRRDAYLVIAQSDAMAQQTYQAFANSLPEEYTVENLKNNVEISNQGDAILITATALSAQMVLFYFVVYLVESWLPGCFNLKAEASLRLYSSGLISLQG